MYAGEIEREILSDTHNIQLLIEPHVQHGFKILCDLLYSHVIIIIVMFSKHLY